MRLGKVIAAWAAVLMLTAAAHAGHEDHAHAEVGKKAPDFTLKDADGAEHSLSDFKDKIVVLTWTNPECPFVVPHNEARTLDQLDAKYDDEKVVFLMIDSTSTRSADQTKETAEKYDLETVTLLDPEGEVGHSYGAKSTPHSFVIDAEGTLVYAGALDNAPLGKVKEGEKVNYVNSALDALLAGKTPEVQTTKAYGCSVKYAS